MIAVAGGGLAGAAEADLHSGLTHLRAGTQAQAELDLAKYRDGERDAEIRQRIDQVLPLLRRPLPGDVREYIAGTIEETVRRKGDPRRHRPWPAYLSRMFPVFP